MELSIIHIASVQLFIEDIIKVNVCVFCTYQAKPYINTTMKSHYKTFLILLLGYTLHSGSIQSQAVHYDFDSLLQNNPMFEPMVKMVMDTFQIFGPEEPLEFIVSTDLKALSKNKMDDEYQVANVIFNMWDTVIYLVRLGSSQEVNFD